MPTATKKKATPDKPGRRTSEPTARDLEVAEGEYVLVADSFDQVVNERDRQRGRQVGRTVEAETCRYRKGDVVPLYRNQVARLIRAGAVIPREHLERSKEVEAKLHELEERKAELEAELRAIESQAAEEIDAEEEARAQEREERARQAEEASKAA